MHTGTGGTPTRAPHHRHRPCPRCKCQEQRGYSQTKSMAPTTLWQTLWLSCTRAKHSFKKRTNPTCGFGAMGTATGLSLRQRRQGRGTFRLERTQLAAAVKITPTFQTSKRHAAPHSPATLPAFRFLFMCSACRCLTCLCLVGLWRAVRTVGVRAPRSHFHVATSTRRTTSVFGGRAMGTYTKQTLSIISLVRARAHACQRGCASARKTLRWLAEASLR